MFFNSPLASKGFSDFGVFLSFLFSLFLCIGALSLTVLPTFDFVSGNGSFVEIFCFILFDLSSFFQLGWCHHMVPVFSCVDY